MTLGKIGFGRSPRHVSRRILSRNGKRPPPWTFRRRHRRLPGACAESRENTRWSRPAPIRHRAQTFPASWHDFGLTFVTRRKFTMPCLPWRAPPRLQNIRHPTQLPTATPPPGMPPDACERPCGLGGACPQELELAHTPARCAGYSVCTCRRPSFSSMLTNAKTCPAAYRRLPEDEAAPAN